MPIVQTVKPVDNLRAVRTVNPQLAEKHRARVGHSPPACDLKRQQSIWRFDGYNAIPILGPLAEGKKGHKVAFQPFPSQEAQIADMDIEVVPAGVFKPGAQRQIGVGSAWLHRYGQGSSLGRQQYSVRSFRYDGGQEAGKFLQRPARSEIGTVPGDVGKILRLHGQESASGAEASGGQMAVGPLNLDRPVGHSLVYYRLRQTLEIHRTGPSCVLEA